MVKNNVTTLFKISPAITVPWRGYARPSCLPLSKKNTVRQVGVAWCAPKGGKSGIARLPFCSKGHDSIPTAPTIHLPDRCILNKITRGQKGAAYADDPGFLPA